MTYRLEVRLNCYQIYGLRSYRLYSQFWNSFDTSIKMNKRGLDGKQRILSVIANDFGRQEIKGKLNVGLKKIFFSNFL